MAYSNAAAISRPEISAFLEEAQSVENLLIGAKVLPVYTSEKRAGRYPKLRIQNGELLNSGGALRGPTGTYPEVNREWEWDTFDCEDRGLEERIDDTLREEMSDFFDLEVTTAKLVRRALMLQHEIRAAAAVMATGTFTTTNSSVAYSEANAATVDFAKDITDAIARMEALGQVPNTLVMSRTVFNRIRRTTKLQTYIYGNIPGAGNKDITPSSLGNAFDVPLNVLISGSSYNTAKKGQTYSLSSIWGTSHISLCSVAGGEFQNGGMGRTIVWGSDCPGGQFCTETYRSEARRSDTLRVRTHDTLKILDATAAQLIATQWA